MMDRKTIEKIAEARLSYIILNWRDNLDNTRMSPQELAQTLMKVLKEEFGYYQLPKGTPPIKTDDLASFAEELQGNAQFINSDLVAQIQHVMWQSRKSQRDSDWEWIRG